MRPVKFRLCIGQKKQFLLAAQVSFNRMSEKPSRIKILVILPYLHQGGTQRHVSYLLENIDKERFDVHLGYFINHDVFYKNLVVDPTHAHVMGNGNTVNAKSWLDIIKTVKRLKPDIVHFYMQSANMMGGFAHYFFPKTPVIFSIGMTKQPFWHYWFYRFLKRRPTLTFCNSRRARDEMIEFGKLPAEKTIVVHNPLDTDHFRPPLPGERRKARDRFGLPENAFILASIGRISHQKNQQGTVRAVRRLRERNLLPKNFHLIFVGKCHSSEYEAELKKEIAAFGLEGVCSIREPIEDILSFYHGVDGVFQPSHHEGLSNVAIECQACGTPVALSREGDNDMLIEDGQTGVSFSIENDESLTEGLRRLIELCGDSAERARVTEKARTEVKKRFSLPEAIKLREAIYEDLLGRAG